MDLREARKDIKKVYVECQEAFKKLDAIEADEFFVRLERIPGETYQEIDEWLFDNNIIAKQEDHSFTIHLLANVQIFGYRFKHKEDAMAFKLRWE